MPRLRRYPRRTLALAAFCSAVAAVPAHAQIRDTSAVRPIPVTIECAGDLSPATCTGTVTQVDSLQRFEIHLQLKSGGSGLPGATVRLRATSGTLLGDSTVSVGPAGDVRAIWLRSRGSDAVGIAVEAHPATGSRQQFSAVRYIQLNLPEPKAAIGLVADVTQDFPPSGFENAPLRAPMIVEIRKQARPNDTVGEAIEDPAVCQSQRVVFRGSAGTMTPDTAVPEVYVAGPRNSNPASWWRGCRAQAHWSIGAGAGPREARFTLVPGRGYEAYTKQTPYRWDVQARSLPRFVLGGVFRFDRTYLGRDDGDKVVYRVERPRPDGGKVTFDSTAPGSVTVDAAGKTSFGVMVGVSAPIPLPQTNRLTVVAGVDLTAPLDHQYLGFSILRLANLPETLPLDLSLLGHFGTIHELKRPDECRLGVSSNPDLDPCGTRRRWLPRGVGVMFSIDAGTLLAEAIKKLGS